MNNVIYTDRFIKPWAAGCAWGPIVLIRPKYRDDVGLLEHEQVHVRQFWRTFGLHGLLYWLLPKYRLAAEAEAYAKQYARRPDKLALYASFIVKRYGLKVTQGEAEVAILSFSIESR